MNQLSVPQILLLSAVLVPGLVFLGLALAWLAGWNPKERTTSGVTMWAYGLAGLTLTALIFSMAASGVNSVTVELGNWYAVHSFQIPLVLFADRLSVPLLALTILLAGLVAAFSRRYIHRDRGFQRFFLLLNLFTFGALLLFAAGSFDLLIAGWELVCITSVLLIAFFQERPEPVQNAIRVYATYRGCDLGIMIGVFALHHFTGSAAYGTLFTGSWPMQETALSGGSATLAGLLLLLAASGKSAQVPFSGWLPRAMEGPTPSSAIFYGGISVHAGAYLLLRCQPILEASPIASGAVVAVGFLSAVHGTMVARACSDVKTSLAYSSVSQLGLIFVEIGLGLWWLALVHIAGHAIVRTLQFLRAPSMLHDFHGIHAAAGGHLAQTGAHYEALLPAGMQLWLYRLALDRGHHDAMLDRFVVGPVQRVAQVFATLERRLTGPRTEVETAPLVTGRVAERSAEY